MYIELDAEILNTTCILKRGRVMASTLLATLGIQTKVLNQNVLNTTWL